MRVAFKNWPVIVKMAAAFVSIMVALICVDSLVGQKFDDMDHRVSQELGQEAVPGLEAMAQLNYSVPLMRVHIYRYCFFTDPERRAKIVKELASVHDDVNTHLAAYRASLGTGDPTEINALNKNLDQYWWWVEKTRSVVEGGGDNKAVQETMAQYTALYNNIDKQMKALVAKNDHQVKEAVAATTASVSESRTLLRGAIIASGALSIASLLLLMFSIALPLRRTSRLLQRVSQGEVGEIEEPRKRTDEIGTVQRAAYDTSKYMQEMATVAAKIADGNLRVTVNPRSQGDVMGVAFENMTTHLRASVQSISESARNVVEASHQLDDTSGRLDADSTTAALQSRESEHAVETVNGGIQTVATASKELSQTVEEISRQTAAISSRMQEAAGSAEQMRDATASADSMVEMISSIASQTNLLALNAAIEAARAGEAGKGFTVVADEVSKLAQETSNATNDIAALLKQMSEQATLVYQATSEVRDAAQTVAGAVEEQSITTREIGRNMDDAARGADAVVRNTSATARTIESTQDAAAQVKVAAGALNEVADNLNATVNRFSL